MKITVVTTIGALLAGGAFAQVTPANDAITAPHTPAQNEPSPAEEPTLREKARNFWIKSKGYLSEDKETFTTGAKQALIDLGKEIDDVAAKAGADTPPYFSTRVQALRQQHSHLQKKLDGLSAEAIQTRMSGPRYAFDKCLGSLESAIDQADDEADVLVKVKSSDKKETKEE